MSNIRQWLEGLGIGDHTKAFERERITLNIYDNPPICPSSGSFYLKI